MSIAGRLVNAAKVLVLRLKYPQVKWPRRFRVLGPLPVFKMGPQCRATIGEGVVFNSDWRRSNTALTCVCHFALGVEGQLVIGPGTQLNGVNITAYRLVEIGSYCQVAGGGLITDTDFHPIDPGLRLKQVSGQPYPFSTVAKEPVSLGDNVWLGWAVVVLKGVHIGDNSILGAGSVVTRSIPENTLSVGNPARVVRKL